MPYFSQVRINCLADYINEIASPKNSNNKSSLWYRGHADGSWELLPKVQRNFDVSFGFEALCRVERYLTNDFQPRACLLNGPKPRLDDYAGWLTLMQHYGLATRLLDWSRSPLVALYFAVSDEEFEDKDACVWILNPYELNRKNELEKKTITGEKEYENTFIYNMSHKTITTMLYTAFKRWELSENPDAITPEDYKFNHRFNTLKDKIAACYPTEADGRVYNQVAAFTVHNSLQKLVDVCDENSLMNICIPKESKMRLREELSICGITESHIYPDFEHLAKEIEKMYGDLWN